MVTSLYSTSLSTPLSRTIFIIICEKIKDSILFQLFMPPLLPVHLNQSAPFNIDNEFNICICVWLISCNLHLQEPPFLSDLTLYFLVIYPLPLPLRSRNPISFCAGKNIQAVTSDHFTKLLHWYTSTDFKIFSISSTINLLSLSPTPFCIHVQVHQCHRR